jgi:hypothetical protein
MTQALAGKSAGGPLAQKAPHFPAKAKHVIFLFLNGGISQVDTFDPKPALEKYNGQPLPGPKIQTDRASGNLMASPFRFSKRGKSGIDVSEIFQKIDKAIDDVCVMRSLSTDSPSHVLSLPMMNCGHRLPGRPSLGSWVTYGLGTQNENLPGFVVLCPGTPTVGPSLWSSAFLPNSYQGTYIANNEVDPEKLIENIRNKTLSTAQQEQQIELLDKLDHSYLGRIGYQPELESSIELMEVAFRMQTEAPEVFDIRKETAATRARYGDSDFGHGCLMALRLVEHGVRMVQVYYGERIPWDSHDDIQVHARLAHEADGPIASLIQDLKSRGLFDETLVIIGSEFGRTPMIQNSGLERIGRGRDHNSDGFTMLLAGGGIKRGLVYGATDEFGFKAVEKPVHVHDLHATILHLLGLDHTKLTYRYSGRDFRLTDVYGNVVTDILT